MIWKKCWSIEQLNHFCQQSAVDYLGIKITQQGSDWLEAKLTVTPNTCQPMGFLHGGVSITLAETIASLAGFCCVDEDQIIMGSEISASHLLAVKQGEIVTARATPLKIGSSQQVWNVHIYNNTQRLCTVVRTTLAVKKVKK